MKTSFKFFLVDGDEFILGPGKVTLLRLVDRHGSLRKAAQDMGMSYRWAWGRIRKAEQAIGVPLLVHEESSKSRAKSLSPEAREIIEWYSDTEKRLLQVMEKAERNQPKSLQND